MLKIQSLKFAYTSETEFVYPDLELKQGEYMAIIGASGSGKSTLIQLISGWRKFQEGSITFFENDLSSYSMKELAMKMAIVHQNMHFLPSLNVKENLLIGAQIGGNPVHEKLFEKVEELGLSSKLMEQPGKLSRGEQQRLSLLRAFASSPALLLADEPTASLDDIQCEKVMSLMLNLCQESNTALLIVTHDARVKTKMQKVIKL